MLFRSGEPRVDAPFDQDYAPDRVLEDGERISGPGWTLTAVATPGHTSNHLCFALEGSGALFTGDHVMQGSTVVINPPDGDMQAYLAALQALLDEDIEWFAPGHGFLVAQPQQVIRGLVAHRLKREAKVAAAMRTMPHGSHDDWVKLAYDDVPPRLWPVAKRSLLAHVERIESLGGFNL